MDRDSREKHFWNNYLALLVDHGIKPSFHPWYVRHCECFIRANEETRLKQHSAASISHYLSGLVQAGDQKPWQKKQQIDAIKILFESIRAPLCRQIDWEHWKSSCHDLSDNHDTNYRSNHPLFTRTIASADSVVTADQQAIENLVDSLRIAIRRKNYSIRTEKSYVDWVRRFVNFIGFSDDVSIEPDRVVSFLEYLAIERQVSPKTQSLALNSLSFLFKSVLERELGDISHFVRPRARQRVPIILTREEVNLILAELDGVHRLVVSLLYGAGLRIMEAVRLRVQDTDFGYKQIIIRNGKGNKERILPLPARLAEPLRQHLGKIKLLHQEDLNQGNGRVYLPDRLSGKFSCADNQ